MKKSAVLWFCSVGLVLAGVAFLAFPYTQWGFLSDDFGLIWHSKVDSLAGLLNFFGEKGLHTFLQPANYQAPPQSFFAVLYRPVLYVIYAVQNMIFGMSPYGFLCVSALLHGINAGILLLLLQRYFSLIQALLGAGYFLFHGSLVGWFGWATGQQHIIALTLLLIAFLMLQAYENRARWWLALGSVVLFVLSLMVREVGIIFPIWLLFYYAVRNYRSYTESFEPALVLSLSKDTCASQKCYISWPLLSKASVRALRQCWFMWVGVLLFFGFRMIRFPMQRTENDLTAVLNPLVFIANLKNRFFDAVTWMVDLLNLSWLGSGNRMLKGMLIMLALALVSWLWWQCQRKREVLFWTASMFMIAWPAILRFYTSRYLYEALPCLVVAMLLLVFGGQFSQRQMRARSALLALLVLFNGVALYARLRERESFLARLDQAFTALAVEVAGGDKPLCFVGLPYDVFPTGVAQGLYMHGVPASRRVYYDKGTFVLPTHLPQKNVLSFERDGSSMNIKIHDNAFARFSFQDVYTAMGQKTFEQSQSGTVMHWLVDHRYDTKNMIFVTWDYENSRFIVPMSLNAH